mgnify:CR=1 FL=1
MIEMKCLLTGVNGVVGKNLNILLSEKYHFDVWGCGRQPDNDAKYFCLDLVEKQAVFELFSKNRFDCVIHCAATINDHESFEMFSNNITSTLNIVEACIAFGVKRFFHTSGITVVGETLVLPITEEHPTKPISAYLLSKLHSEQIIELYCEGRINFVNMRIPSPVGRNMPLRSIFPILLDKIKKDETITLTGDARRRQNFLDIRDLAGFIYKACSLDDISGVFNVAAKRSFSNLELAEAIISKVNSNSKIINEMSQGTSNPQIWEVSTLKAKEHVGYFPEHDLNDTIDWVLKS